jgi:hypothetical protein
MYGKAFAKMYTGSMMGAGAHVFVVWGYAIANAGRNHTVDLNPVHLAALIGFTEAEATRAIEFLCAPDPRSQSTAENGARLKHEGGFMYTLVNGAHYRAIRDEADRREYLRVKKQESRARLAKERAVLPTDEAVK